MLGDEIGKGAYGRVYKGLDLENGDFVAIKQVSLENIAQEDPNITIHSHCHHHTHTKEKETQPIRKILQCAHKINIINIT